MELPFKTISIKNRKGDLYLSILQENWKTDEYGNILKEDGTIISKNISQEEQAFLMSKAPELWRTLVESQNQIEVASELLEKGKVTEAKSHLNSSWNFRRKLISNISKIY